MVDRAIILAAGRGTRLRERHGQPKCLLDIEGTTLLDRYIRTLDALGYAVTIVTGYRSADMRDRLRTLAPQRSPTVLVNDRFEEGSILSLACALDVVDGPLLLLDGDVLFHPELLHRLATVAHEDALLVDVGTAFTTEEYMAGVDAGRVTELRRGPVPGHEACGEWVGFARLSAPTVTRFRQSINVRMDRGETRGGYEDALASLLPSTDVRCVPTDGLPWIEIDFPDDLRRAEEMLRTGSLGG